MIIALYLNSKIGDEQAVLINEVKEQMTRLRRLEDGVINTKGHRLLKFRETYGITVLNESTRGDKADKRNFIAAGRTWVLDLFSQIENEKYDKLKKLSILSHKITVYKYTSYEFIQ